MNTKLLIVNYHYIREQWPDRGINGVSPNFFSSQLDAIHANGFDFVSLQDINSAIVNRSLSALPQKSCLITFDDGLKESYEIGLPIMDKKGIPGAFYVCSGAIQRKILLDVHKFHIILSTLSNETIFSLLPTNLSRRLDTVTSDYIVNQYIWDDYDTGCLKYLFNFLLSDAERKEILVRLFEYCQNSDRRFIENFYMSVDQIQSLSQRGYLGSHGHMHVPLATLPKPEIEYEITNSRKILFDFTRSNVNSISYPYGSDSAINEDVINTVLSAGLISGLTMTRGINIGQDIIDNPLRLKRLDTNDIYGGKSESKYQEYLRD